jgi:shikimate kinase
VRGTVVATGGGTFVDPRNRELMIRDGLVIWLDVPLATVLERVPPDGRRPLAADRATLEALYNQRLAAYRLAPVRVDASRGPVDLLVDQIVDGLEM